LFENDFAVALMADYNEQAFISSFITTMAGLPSSLRTQFLLKWFEPL
jgi:hypothetical protein